MTNFEIKAYPEIWKDLDMDVERFDKMRLMLGEIYEKNVSVPKEPTIRYLWPILMT